MQKVDLYMENDGKTPAVQEARYGYVLAYQGRELHTATGFGICVANRHRRDLICFLEALKRCKMCFLIVHTDSAYLKGGYSRLEQYIQQDWIKTDGKPVKNADLWREVYEAAKGKDISFVFGQHEYTGWLQGEIQKRKEQENV